MSDKSIAIIGAGIGGLSTGIFGRINGFRTTIFEQHTIPGGVAAAWKRKGFLFDGGIHFLMGADPGTDTDELYRTLGIVPQTETVEMETFCRYVDQATGRSIDITSDLDRFVRDVAGISSQDAAIFEELVRASRSFRDIDLMAGLRDAPGLQSFIDKLKTFWGMRSIGRYMAGKWNADMRTYSQRAADPFCRFVLQNLFLPQVPVWFVLMLLGYLAGRNMHLLAKGSLSFARDIESRYKELGGGLHYKSMVERIIVESDRAIGVKLADGTEHRADYVVSAADGYSTIFRLLDGKYSDPKIRGRYDSWDLMDPIMTVSFGVDGGYGEHPWLHIIRLAEPFKAGQSWVESICTRLFNYNTNFAPAGKTSFVTMLETDWQSWNDLAKDRPAYDAAKQQVADAVAKALDERFPGFADAIEAADVASPVTWHRYTLNHRAAYEGFLPTPLAISETIERRLPGLDNFYMAGQWVVPGGGVPPTLFTGRHAVQLVCSDDGRKFRGK